MDLLIVQFLIPMTTMNTVILKSRVEFHAAKILLYVALLASENQVHVAIPLVTHSRFTQMSLSIGTGLPKIQVRICRI